MEVQVFVEVRFELLEVPPLDFSSSSRVASLGSRQPGGGGASPELSVGFCYPEEVLDRSSKRFTTA